MEGQLVGINTAILSRSGGYQGIGFAIPTNMAEPDHGKPDEDGKVARGWLGVSIQDVDQELTARLEAASEHLGRVAQRSYVARWLRRLAPVCKRGDVVQKVNGQPVNSTGEFRNAIASAGTGARSSSSSARRQTPRSSRAELGEMPAEPGSDCRANRGQQVAAREPRRLDAGRA